MEPGSKIILETKRLIFRPHVMADMDAWCDREAEPEVRRYAGGRPRTREEAEHRFKERALKPISGRLGMWAAVFKPEDKYIGRCGVYPHFTASGEAIPAEGVLGYYISPGYWGKGLATEAATAFIEFGFNELRLNRIVTTVEAGNDTSVHILRKLGFILAETETGPRSFYHFVLENPNN